MQQNQNKERQQRGCRRRAQPSHLHRLPDRACRSSVGRKSIVCASRGDPARSRLFFLEFSRVVSSAHVPRRFLRWAAQPTSVRSRDRAGCDAGRKDQQQQHLPPNHRPPLPCTSQRPLKAPPWPCKFSNDPLRDPSLGSFRVRLRDP